MGKPARVLTIYPQKRLAAALPVAINEKMTFAEAATPWLESRRLYIGSRTYKDYGYYIARVSDFFGGIRLEDIDGDHLREFQQLRARTCAGSVINHELGVVVQILKRVNRWPIPGGYEPLPLPKESPGRCIEDWEERRYFKVAAANPNWQVAYLASTIMRRTGICPGELRQVRLKDVDEEHKALHILFGKNQYRERWVPLSAEASEALGKLLERANKLGSVEPGHYLLPYRSTKSRYDPTRSASPTFMRASHREICAAAGIKMREYDWRHTAASRLLENPQINTETAIAILGHVSPRMVRRVYNHTRFEVARAAVESLDTDPKTRRPGKRKE